MISSSQNDSFLVRGDGLCIIFAGKGTSTEFGRDNNLKECVAANGRVERMVELYGADAHFRSVRV